MSLEKRPVDMDAVAFVYSLAPLPISADVTLFGGEEEVVLLRRVNVWVLCYVLEST